MAPITSVFAYYSSLMPYGFEANKAHAWRIAITDYLFFALVIFGTTACDGVIMSKGGQSAFAADSLGMLMKCLTVWTAGLQICTSSLSLAR